MGRADTVRSMAIEWAGLGPELLLRLDRGGGQPLRAPLETPPPDAIRRGRLRAGGRPPPPPAPARDLGDGRRPLPQREGVAGYLRRVRAGAAGPENLIVCTGFAQGLNLVLRVLTGLGVGRVAFEDPGHGDAEASTSVRSAVQAGAQAVHVPVDDLGGDVAALEASGAPAGVVTPAPQSPPGGVLAPGRRPPRAERAARHDAVAV